MPEHVSILQQIGLAVLAIATVAWVVGLVRLVRTVTVAPPEKLPALPLGALPGQAQAPALESVSLTPDERDAFAGLVRQFSRG
ncbi:hypothetical protein [Streptomyces beihaiensis]|uniref:Uncharacterized protein n=1 Tax=Streptomyces beihaiensis TaxID=2984495 RepID=A0ABT3TN20_9ACTN|nr:hypothetical protein [Streptomyces beihaiensis]MCX3058445.1 hypothetical protein [Streptomyces beihaiensis]